VTRNVRDFEKVPELVVRTYQEGSGASRARTGDPRPAKAVLSQLGYGPFGTAGSRRYAGIRSPVPLGGPKACRENAHVPFLWRPTDSAEPVVEVEGVDLVNLSSNPLSRPLIAITLLHLDPGDKYVRRP
jgi:hypothetical protein